MPKETLRSKLMRLSIPVTECGCWIWMGDTMSAGYGRCQWAGTRTGAHRLSFQEFNGPIPDGLFVCHHCDVPLCINPDHLFVGTHDDNMNDKFRKGRNSSLPGVLSPRAILTEEDVAEILTSRDTSAHLARKFKVNPVTIHCVRSGKSWKHITGGQFS